MLELAIRYEADNPVRVREISASHGIPMQFLVQILQQLKQAGMVASLRGAGGGYRLALPPDKVTLANIVAALDRPSDGRRRRSTSRAAQAMVDAFSAAAVAEQHALESVTLADLVAQSAVDKEAMYYI